MRAEHGRWAFVRLTLTCSACGAETVQRAPEAQTDCAACGARIEVTAFPRIAAETGAPLDRLAWGATRSTPDLVVGRQQPLCWSCGDALTLSAADLGETRRIHCSSCDAVTETAPASAWLKRHLPDAAQIYVAPGSGAAHAAEPIWIRCAACQAGMRVDAETEQITRCGSCHALNHVPDPVWRALHPVRHGAPWFVLFETLTRAERAARRQAQTELTEAIEAVGRSGQPVHAVISVLRRHGGPAAEDALFSALNAASPAWFEHALGALAGLPGSRVPTRLAEVLDAESDPARQLAIARAIEDRLPAVALERYGQLVETGASGIVVEALTLWTALEPATGLGQARALVEDAPLAVRRRAVRLLIEHDQLPFDRAVLGIVRNAETGTQRNLLRLLTAQHARVVATALRRLLGAGLDTIIEDLLRDLGGHYAEGALQVAAKAHGVERLRATRWAAAAGAFPGLQALAADLARHDGDVAHALCDALLASSEAARSAALCALLEGPTLKVRLDAAALLETHGGPAAVARLDDVASRWFANRDLKRAAEKAATAIRWRLRHGPEGGLAVVPGGELSDAPS